MDNLVNIIKNEDGSYKTPNEVFYYDLEEFLQIGVLDFCSCGDPESSLTHVYHGLNQIKKKRGSAYIYDSWIEETTELLGSEQAMYFLWYFLDREGFTEHGSSVPGWLTEKGELFLSYLEEYIKELGQ